MLLKGKNAVITGANRGIGRATLELFTQQSANVWACARTQTPQFEALCAELAAQHSVWVKPVYFDLADAEALKAGAKQILGDKLPVDVLVNNAGIVATSAFLMTPASQFEDLLHVNLTAQLQFTQYLAKAMLRQKSGSIVNVSSSSGLDGDEGRLSYSASKAALISATKVMAKELGPHGIRVNAVAPGLVQTDMMQGNTPPQVIADRLAQTCLGRVGEPNEAAQVILFLASDMAGYVTGQTIRVDGGMYTAG